MGMVSSGHAWVGNVKAPEHTFICSFVSFFMARVFVICLCPHSVSFARERHLHHMTTHLVTYPGQQRSRGRQWLGRESHKDKPWAQKHVRCISVSGFLLSVSEYVTAAKHCLVGSKPSTGGLLRV